MFDDERWTRHRAGAGLLLLLALAGFLTLPLWHWRDNSHPLTSAATVDLCMRLRGLPGLAGLTANVQPAQGSAGACQWRDAQDHAQLDAMLMTTRSASSAGAANLGRFYETWRDETGKAGTDDSAEQAQDGIRSFRYRRGDTHEWLLEDHGVLLWLRSDTLDDAALAALAEQIGTELRTQPR